MSERPAILASSFAPHLGGVEELTRRLALELRRQGKTVEVHTMRWPRHLPAVEQIDDLTVRRWSFRSLEKSVRRVIVGLVTNPVTFARFVLALRRQRCDLLNIHCVSASSTFGVWAARLLRIPLVVSVHGELAMDAQRIFERSRPTRRALRRAVARADVITACSQFAADELVAWLGATPTAPLVVVHGGVDPEEFEPRELGPREFGPGRSGPEEVTVERPYVLAAGRLAPPKSFDLLIRSRVEVPAGGPHRLLIAGDGPDRPELEALIAALGLGDRVELLGAVPHDRMAALFAGADAFVMPSSREALGLVNLEAMAAGVPVIATRVGGVPEIVEHEVSGLLVAPDDPAAIADALDRLAGDSELRQTLIAGGHAVAIRCAWPVVAAQYSAVYECTDRVRGARSD